MKMRTALVLSSMLVAGCTADDSQGSTGGGVLEAGGSDPQGTACSVEGSPVSCTLALWFATGPADGATPRARCEKICAETGGDVDGIGACGDGLDCGYCVSVSLTEICGDCSALPDEPLDERYCDGDPCTADACTGDHCVHEPYGWIGDPCQRSNEFGTCDGVRVCGPTICGGMTGHTCAKMDEATCGAPVPAWEAQDGADNDCDGETDEDPGPIFPLTQDARVKEVTGDGLADGGFVVVSTEEVAPHHVLPSSSRARSRRMEKPSESRSRSATGARRARAPRRAAWRTGAGWRCGSAASSTHSRGRPTHEGASSSDRHPGRPAPEVIRSGRRTRAPHRVTATPPEPHRLADRAWPAEPRAETATRARSSAPSCWGERASPACAARPAAPAVVPARSACCSWSVDRVSRSGGQCASRLCGWCSPRAGTGDSSPPGPRSVIMKPAAFLMCFALIVDCSDGGGSTGVTQNGGVPADTGVTGSPGDSDGAVTGEPGTPTAAAITIATLGDSLTEGTGDSEWTASGAPVGYPGRLEARLKARGSDVAVTNLGRSGWTSTDLVSGVDWGEGPEPSELSLAIPVLEAALADGRKAVATVWIGSNDLFSVYDWCHAPDNVQCEADNLKEYEANVDETLGQLTATGATVLVALLDDQSKRPVVADPGYADSFPGIGPAERAAMSAQVVRYNAAITKFAEKHGAKTVNTYHTTIFEEPATLDDDGNHPNAAGYEAITTIWESALNQALDL